MKLPKLQTLVKLLICIVLLSLAQYVVFSIFFNPTKEAQMALHFKKASIYDTKVVRRILSNETVSRNGSAENDAGRIKSFDHFRIPAMHNRWQVANELSVLEEKNIEISLNSTCKPVNYTTYQTSSYCLQHDIFLNYFATSNGKHFCLKEGTEFFNNNGTSCTCRSRWHGTYCSMPDVVLKSNYPREFGFKYQNPLRRLINAFPFTHEFDMLETRFNEYGDLVDLYLIVESNYTASGQPKSRSLKRKLNKGYLKEFQHKILYVSLDYFPRKAFYNGWIVDALLRNHMAEHGLLRVQNLRPDDVFVLNDADELPTRETLMFLKLHMSYPEPVGFYISHNVYGFQWLGQDVMTHVFGACSMSMLQRVFRWQPYSLRSASKSMQNNKQEVSEYRYRGSGSVGEWSAGNDTEGGEGAAGWHCSWCFSPKGIKAKLEAAHWSDLPRWGAYPSKTSEEYIKNLTLRGLWFDDRTKLIPARPNKAPKYILNHSERFQHLLGSDW